MAYQITGNIEMVGPIVSRPSSNGNQQFNSRFFVLDATRFNPETGEPWENHPRFDLSGKNVNLIDNYQVGQRVTVDFVVRGAKYKDKTTGETKYYTTISAFRITPIEQHGYRHSTPSQPTTQLQQQPDQQIHQPFPPQVDSNGSPIQDYDLPF